VPVRAHPLQSNRREIGSRAFDHTDCSALDDWRTPNALGLIGRVRIAVHLLQRDAREIDRSSRDRVHRSARD
jgi:hypothetical protein